MRVRGISLLIYVPTTLYNTATSVLSRRISRVSLKLKQNIAGTSEAAVRARRPPSGAKSSEREINRILNGRCSRSIYIYILAAKCNFIIIEAAAFWKIEFFFFLLKSSISFADDLCANSQGYTYVCGKYYFPKNIGKILAFCLSNRTNRLNKFRSFAVFNFERECRNLWKKFQYQKSIYIYVALIIHYPTPNTYISGITRSIYITRRFVSVIYTTPYSIPGINENEWAYYFFFLTPSLFSLCFVSRPMFFTAFKGDEEKFLRLGSSHIRFTSNRKARRLTFSFHCNVSEWFFVTV